MALLSKILNKIKQKVPDLEVSWTDLALGRDTAWQQFLHLEHI